jgi:hypothetical protein
MNRRDFCLANFFLYFKVSKNVGKFHTEKIFLKKNLAADAETIFGNRFGWILAPDIAGKTPQICFRLVAR